MSFNFRWISHLSPIKFPTLSTWLHIFQIFNFDIGLSSIFLGFQISRFSKFVIFHFFRRTEMFPTLSKWLDIFRFGFGRSDLWCSKFLGFVRPRLSYTFLVFLFSKILSVELKCFPHYKSDWTFYDSAFDGSEITKCSNFLWYGISFTFSSFWFFKFCIFMFSSGELSGQWLYTIGPHFQQDSNF